ncbi:MAG TPA: SpoIIE family protein phosphatase [Leptospiraceae bacterium]|nr:SpoIIE family protein phosphatase [Leptospiraceae bacterium]
MLRFIQSRKKLSLWIFSALNFIFSCSVCLISFYRSGYVLTEAADSRLTVAANAVDFILTLEYHEKESIDSDEYSSLNQKLNRYANEADVSYLYSFSEKEGRFYNTSSSVLFQDEIDRFKSSLMLEIKESEQTAAFARALQSGKTVFADFSGKWGNFRSVIVPHISKNGRKYITGAEIKTDVISEQKTETLYDSVFYGFCLFILLLIIYYDIVYLEKFHKIRNLLNSRKMPGAVSAAAAALSVLWGISFFKDEKLNIYKSADSRLYVSALSLKYILPDDYHEKADSGDREMPTEYVRQSKVLKLYSERIHTEYLYTYMEKNGNYYYTSCSFTEADIKNGTVPKYLEEVDKGSRLINASSENSASFFDGKMLKWGNSRTAAVPVRNLNRKPFLAASDIKSLELDRAAFRSFFTAALFGISAFFFTVLILSYAAANFDSIKYFINIKYNRFISIKFKLIFMIGSIFSMTITVLSLLFLYNSKTILKNKTLDVCENFAVNISNIAREDLVLDTAYEAANTVVGDLVRTKVEGLLETYILNVYGKYVVDYSGARLGEFTTEKEIKYLQEITLIDLQETVSPKNGRYILRITYPIYINYNNQSLKIGAAVFEFDRDAVYAPIYKMQKIVFFFGILFLTVILALTYFLSGYITDPILSLSKAVQTVSDGNLDYKIEVQTNDEVGILSEKFNVMSANLKISYSHLEEKVQERTAELNATLKLIQRDLALAEKIQSTALHSDLSLFKNLEIAVRYIPMTEVGGDFYSISPLEKKVRVFLADATGHGVQAALIVMAIQGIYEGIKNFALPVNEVLDIFNREFVRRYGTINSYLSCVLMDIDTENERLMFASAGHPPGLLVRSDRQIQLLERTGSLIGVRSNSIYTMDEFVFQKNEKIYVFTDGIFEEFMAEEEFGEDRLHLILKEDQSPDMDTALDAVLNKLNDFLENTGPQDDITFIGIKFPEG